MHVFTTEYSPSLLGSDPNKMASSDARFKPALRKEHDMSQNKRGRPAAIDHNKTETIVGMLSLGCTRANAARYVGCTPETLRKTAKRDPKFAERMRQAEMNLEMKHMNNLVNASGRSWRASAWVLERLNPRRFGRRRADAYSPDQIKGLIELVAGLLVDEVADSSDRKKICDRLERIAQKLDSVPEARRMIRSRVL